MATIRRHHHSWTNFEHHTLLCLLCRQIQLTGTSSPTRVRKGGRTKPVFSLSSSRKNAYRDVADLLNRSLNYGNHEHDIPAEEVSAEIDRLMDERKDAVRFMERQRVGRITGAMKRVWERGFKVENLVGAEKGRSGKGRSKVTGAAPDEPRGIADELGNQEVDVQMANAEDPWGDNVAASTAIAQNDPWGDEAMTTFAKIQDTNDGWGTEPIVASNADVQSVTEPRRSTESTVVKTTTSDANVQDASDPWGSSESSFAKKSVLDDPWGSAESTLAYTTNSDDPWATWTSTAPAGSTTNTSDDPWVAWTATDGANTNATTKTNDPWADVSTTLQSTTASDFISSQSRAQSVTSPGATTAPTPPAQQTTVPKEAFTGLNSARLAMLGDAGVRSEREITIQQPAYAIEGKGENAVELPFNRFARMNEDKEAGDMQKIGGGEMDTSEEE